MTNSERMVSRQRALFPLPGEAKPDWSIVTEVARRMGWKTAFAYDRPADIWREHCRLSTYENAKGFGGSRLFALPGQAAMGKSVLRQAQHERNWAGRFEISGISRSR